MRIFHIIPYLSGGGAERQLSYLAPELVRMGHEVHIAYSKDGPHRPELLGVVLHQLHSWSNYDPYLFWQVNYFIRQIKPDIIHTWIPQMDILGGVASRINRRVWVIRESVSGMAYPPNWKYRLRVMVGSGANAIVSNSQSGDEYWKSKLPYIRRYVIANALPIDKINSAMSDLPQGLSKTNASLVLYVGRLEETQKKPKAFLEALAKVRKKLKVKAILCGEGPYQLELEKLSNVLGLSSDVYFAGYLPETLVWTLMKKASVFVSLSAYEGCPNTVMEAMACGCPLVLSDIPEHRAILDDSCAIFVDPSNIQQTTEAIVATLRNEDASKSRSLIAKKKAQEWTIVKTARNWERVYKNLME